MLILGCTQRESKTSKNIVENYRDTFESRMPAGPTEKLPYSEKFGANISSWPYDMEGHAKKCVEIFCELDYTKSQLHALTTINPKKKNWDLLENCPKSLLTHCFSKMLVFRAHCGPNILWFVNKLARSITKWARACDTRLARLISYILKQYCHAGNTAQQCRSGLFQGLDFAGDLEDSKSTSGGLLCTFGSHTLVPLSWMCKKQTSVSHRSTEAEVLSRGAGLRMDGIPALDHWDLVIEVFHSSPNQLNHTKGQVRGESSRKTTSNEHTQNQTKIPIHHDNLELSNVYYVSSNAKPSTFWFNALCF